MFEIAGQILHVGLLCWRWGGGESLRSAVKHRGGDDDDDDDAAGVYWKKGCKEVGGGLCGGFRPGLNLRFVFRRRPLLVVAAARGKAVQFVELRCSLRSEGSQTQKGFQHGDLRHYVKNRHNHTCVVAALCSHVYQTSRQSPLVRASSRQWRCGGQQSRYRMWSRWRRYGVTQ